ncbi:MAG: hypothetical protein JWM27_4182, partial [Gemmatimonadetes bacterium]|nr:hypothetical protein [Gemmatimonadota bacterium]
PPSPRPAPRRCCPASRAPLRSATARATRFRCGARGRARGGGSDSSRPRAACGCLARSMWFASGGGSPRVSAPRMLSSAVQSVRAHHRPPGELYLPWPADLAGGRPAGFRRPASRGARPVFPRFAFMLAVRPLRLVGDTARHPCCPNGRRPAVPDAGAFASAKGTERDEAPTSGEVRGFVVRRSPRASWVVQGGVDRRTNGVGIVQVEAPADALAGASFCSVARLRRSTSSRSWRWSGAACCWCPRRSCRSCCRGRTSPPGTPW